MVKFRVQKTNTEGRLFKLLRQFTVGEDKLVRIRMVGIGEEFVLAEDEWLAEPFEFTGREEEIEEPTPPVPEPEPEPTPEPEPENEPDSE
jgi:hypothetical protein